MMDVKVLFKTIVTVLKRENIYVSAEKPVNLEEMEKAAQEKQEVVK